MIHVDTSFVIAALSQGSPQDHHLRAWLRAHEPVGISTVAWAELLCGPIGDDSVDRLQRIVTPRLALTETEAVLAARMFNAIGRRRGSLADCMIAATAVCHSARLATNNTADFRRIARAGFALELVDGATRPDR